MGPGLRAPSGTRGHLDRWRVRATDRPPAGAGREPAAPGPEGPWPGRPRRWPPVAGWRVLPRKEVIQPQLPLRLPCYDFVPVIGPTLGACLPEVGPATSGVADSHDVTGGVYKARERIHRRVLTGGY
jgi:hypothetical protein